LIRVPHSCGFIVKFQERVIAQSAIRSRSCPFFIAHQGTVISTKAAHAFVSSGVEKSAFPPQTSPSHGSSTKTTGTHLIIPKPADRTYPEKACSPPAPCPAAAPHVTPYR
jgi:hypothetical protein